VIAYIDSSVVLRVLLQAPNALEWATVTRGIASELLRVECHRTLDRLWHSSLLDDRRFGEKRRAAEILLARLELRELNTNILEMATQPLPSVLGTLDALHLATAMVFRYESPTHESMVFATHDKALAKAAREMHFDVIGT
jgi:predicted nucleic acid-binding protein